MPLIVAGGEGTGESYLPLTVRARSDDNSSMDDKPTKRERASGVALVMVLVVVLAVLPFLYVLSIGPAAWLVNSGWLDGAEGSPAYRFYSPLIWAGESCEPVEATLQWYMSLWELQSTDDYVVPVVTPVPPVAAPVPLPAGS